MKRVVAPARCLRPTIRAGRGADDPVVVYGRGLRAGKVDQRVGALKIAESLS